MTYGFDPWDLLGKAWIAFAGLLAWVGKRHLDDNAAVVTRVDTLEKICATHDDIATLHEKIDANHRQVIDLLTRR